MGAWSARHPKTAILGWLAFVIVALAIGSAVPTGEITDSDRMIGENAEAAQILSTLKAEDAAPIFERLDEDTQEAMVDSYRAIIDDLLERRRATVRKRRFRSYSDTAPSCNDNTERRCSPPVA